MARILYLFLVFFPLLSQGAGAWYKNVQQIPSPKAVGFDPDFVIIKAGVFSNKGDLKPVEPKDHWKAHCESNRESIAWFTHKLSKGESLSVPAGALLAANINQLLKSTCFTSIELDIEPLAPFETKTWLIAFLKSVREKLDPLLKLRLAVPSITTEKIPGPYWELADAVKIFRSTPGIDGMDIMLYDTGISTEKEYSELFKNAFFFALELVKEAQDKTILIGLPAYEKTKLHQPAAENLAAIVGMLQTFTPFQAVSFCLKRVSFAYYAGWTLSTKDIEQHQKIKEWKTHVCTKDF